MAEERSQLPGAIGKGGKLWDLWQGYNAAEAMAAGGLSQGMPYPGAISGAVPDAFAGGLSAVSAAPFMALAGYNLSKILGNILSDKPKIGFSGTEPKFSYGKGQYYGQQKDRQPNKKLQPSSKKYNYVISVEDTGRDGEIGKALVQEFDKVFDSLSAQGVPVNQLLERNKGFAFGGRLDKTTTPDTLLRDVFNHMAPDIEAYKAGQSPPERVIQVTPGGTVMGMNRRPANDAAIKNDPYNVIIGDSGAVLEDMNIVLSPNDPRAAYLLAANGKVKGQDVADLPHGISLSPGFTYTLDTSGLPGRLLAESDKYNGINAYTVPGDSPLSPGKSNVTAEDKKNTGEATVESKTDSPVRELYKDLYSMTQPDQEGLEFWGGLWDTGKYTKDQMKRMMIDAERADWSKAPGGTKWINRITGNEVPDTDTPVAPMASIPDNIPAGLQPGLEGFVNDSWDITRQYRETADQLWSDYLDFEKTYFNKFEDNQQQYKNNLSSMPQINLKMPGTMGGATVPLAPKVHSAMYTDQFNAMNTGIGNQANASLAGLGSRDSLAKNIFATNLNNLQNSFLPTQVGLDLYSMERAGQLGINQAEAGKYQPSTMSTWAPVVGSLLQSDFGSSAAEGLWDFGTDLVSSGWDYVTGLFG